MSKRAPDFDLRKAAADPSFVPRKDDLPGLVDLLASDDRDLAEHAERALSRLGEYAVDQAIARIDAATPPLRARLCKLVARASAAHVEFFVARLHDRDGKTQRNAIAALGKRPLGDARDDVEAKLLALFETSPPETRRAIATALGKVGGHASLDVLRAVGERGEGDPELVRIATEARLKIERTTQRSIDAGSIDATKRASGALAVRFHCRAGLEEMLAEELGDRFDAREDGPERVRGVLRDAPLSSIFDARLHLRAGFPLIEARATEDVEALVIETMTSDAAMRLMTTFTRGNVRYRIEWASAGHRRALTYRVADAITKRRPTLVNDPTKSLWEVVVAEADGKVGIELWPRGLRDPRFEYRVRDVPAASHPTIAAALAYVGGVRDDDVVWDPFVGSGSELIERALRGPYARLIGSDVDERALEAARENVERAKVARVTLLRQEAPRVRVEQPVTLVLTNPPMGRRVLDRQGLEPLYEATFEAIARNTRKGARIVFVSPLFDRTIEIARAVGLRSTVRQTLDMGGFDADLQAFVRD